MSESKLQNKNKNKKVTSSGTNNSELENVSSDVVQQINTIHSVLNGKITKVEILYALKENDHDSNLVIDKFFQGTNDWTVVDNKQKTTKKVKATQGGNNTDNKNKSNNKKPKTQENVQVPKKKKTVEHEQDSKASVEAAPAKVKTFVQPQVVEEQKTMSYSQVVSSNQPQKEIIQPTSAQPTKEETKKKSKKNKNVEKPKKQTIQQQISYEPLEQTLTSSFELKQEVVQEEPEEEEEEEEEQSSVILDISNEYNYSDGLNLQFGTLGIQPKEEEKSKNTNQTNFQNSTWDQNQNFMQYQTVISFFLKEKGQNFYQQPTNQPTTQQQGKKEKTSKYVSNQPTQTQPQQPLQQPSYMPNQYGQFYPYPNPYVMQQYQVRRSFIHIFRITTNNFMVENIQTIIINNHNIMDLEMDQTHHKEEIHLEMENLKERFHNNNIFNNTLNNNIHLHKERKVLTKRKLNKLNSKQILIHNTNNILMETNTIHTCMAKCTELLS
jgi:hypothetical protein